MLIIPKAFDLIRRWQYSTSFFFFLLERTWLLLSWGKRACVLKKKCKKVAAKLEEVCP